MLAPLALLTLGCASEPERSVGQLVAGEAFELSITPIYVAGQADMIDEATEIEVILRDLDGRHGWLHDLCRTFAKALKKRHCMLNFY